MKQLIPLTTIACLLFVPLAASARPHLSASHMAALKEGKVLKFSENESKHGIFPAKAIAIIPDVPEAVAYVILDVGKYKHFLPRVKESRVTKYQDGNTFAVIETDLPWPFKDCWAYVKMHRKDKANRVFEIRWKMINGTMKDYAGTALIEPWNEDATKSVVTYTFLGVPKTSAPDASISKHLRKAAGTILQRIRLRLAALRKFGKLPKGF